MSAADVLWIMVCAAAQTAGTMRLELSNKAMRKLIAGIMLLAFATRALVPAGFMPASDRAFSIEICPEGLPAQLLVHAGHHHHHPGGHSQADHCVFGTACASGPMSLAPPLILISLAHDEPATHRLSAAILVQLVHVPQARGPPPAA
jgi:hypothetical protein